MTEVADGLAPTLTVDLGGTHMRCAVVGADGHVLQRHEIDTPHDGRGPEVLVDLMGAVGAGRGCRHAVVGVPGRVNYEAGTLEYAPNLPAGWPAALTETELSTAVGLPVALANDADLAAVGEAWFGAGQGRDDVVYLTLSTGVGAGVVLARRLLHGRRSLVEIGHTVVDLGSSAHRRFATLEDLASGTALARMARESGLRGAGPEIVAAVEAGAPNARAVWDDLVRAAAAGIVNLAWLFAPQVIVVGGGLGLVGSVLLDPVRRVLSASGPPELHPQIEVVEAALGDDAGLAGAAAWEQAFVPESAGRPTADG